MKKVNRIMVGFAVAAALLLLVGKDMSDRRVAEDNNEMTLNEVYDNVREQQSKPQCAEQTIASDCEPRDDVDYSEPIMSGVSKYNSFTNKVEQCPYLYSNEQRKNYFEVYECDQGDDIYQYRTSDDKEVYEDEVAELTNNANY